jgi:hypothetical protein
MFNLVPRTCGSCLDYLSFSPVWSCANSEAPPYSNTAAVICRRKRSALQISVNSLDSDDALRVKDLYALTRKQGEREH